MRSILAILILVSWLGSVPALAQESAPPPDSEIAPATATPVPIPTPTPTTPEQTPLPVIAKVVKEKIRVRRKPSTKDPIVANLLKDAEVLIIDEEVGWYLVTLPNEPEKPIGWVYGKLLKVSEPSTPAKVTTPVAAPAATAVTAAPVAAAGAATSPTPELKVEPTTTPPEAKMESKPEPSSSTPVERKPQPPERFKGHTNYPVPEYKGGRDIMLELKPSFSFVTEDLGGTVDGFAFRGTGIVAVEVVPTVFFEAYYSYVSYTPGLPTHEGGGGIRVQPNIRQIRFHPYFHGDAFYSSFMDDDNIGFMLGLGALFTVTQSAGYDVRIGPSFAYHRVILGGTEDLTSWVIGFSFALANVIAD